MAPTPRRSLRAAFGVVVVVCLVLVASSFVTATVLEDGEETDTVNATADRNLTVFTTQGTTINGKQATIQAVTANRSQFYRNGTHSAYFDVDPVAADYGFESVPGGHHTVEYVAAELHRDETCQPRGIDVCTVNVVERLNLSTGETTRVYARQTPGVDATRYHDADRINATHIAVADIFRDRVMVVDTRTDTVEWQWNASDHFDPGDDTPASDWTHLNDVEVLDNGTLMVSLRDLDQVVFVRPGEGLQANRTLGSDESHGTLYEQHNPDYLANASTPTVLVADSENNRIVEYSRKGDDWERTWFWRDTELQWPRDADRLPGGSTLVVDSHGSRILEVDPRGRVAWSIEAEFPYDAERLGTTDESIPSASAMSGGDTGSETDESADAAGPTDRFWLAVKSVSPPVLVNSALYVAPVWVDFTDLVFGVVGLVTAIVWGGIELRWSSYSLTDAGRWLRSRVGDQVG